MGNYDPLAGAGVTRRQAGIPRFWQRPIHASLVIRPAMTSAVIVKGLSSSPSRFMHNCPGSVAKVQP